jgi:hypothetical protein
MSESAKSSRNTMSEAISSLKAAMRQLWADHVIWTLQYVD